MGFYVDSIESDSKEYFLKNLRTLKMYSGVIVVVYETQYFI